MLTEISLAAHAIGTCPIAAVATGSNRRAHVERRFNELVIKSALSIATPEEEAKLERYQKLRREMNGTACTTRAQARREWKDKQMLKILRRFTPKADSNT